MVNSLKERVRELLHQYRPRLALSQRFETERRSNFLNFVKKIKGENGFVYVMKLPRAFGDITCYLRLAIFHLLGDRGVIFTPFPERMKNEKQKIKFLSARGIPALSPADLDIDGVLVTRHVQGTNLKELFGFSSLSLEDKLKILARSTKRLKEIHAYFSHGDAQVRNILVTDTGETVWLDYEYVINPEMPLARQKARDLMLLISSSIKHLKRPKEVIEAVLTAYPDREVKKAILSASVYQSPAYNFFLNLMNPLLCLKMRKALREYLLKEEGY